MNDFNTVSANAVNDHLSVKVDSLDWKSIADDLDDNGIAILPRLLDPPACQELKELYQRQELFRGRVIMARHGYGRGEYQYFAYPLPEIVANLRQAFYVHLAPIANRWYELMGFGIEFPGSLDQFILRCHQAGQLRPTPLLLKYKTGDYNCLHQDLYGEHLFPLQLVVQLSKPNVDFTGGEFVLTEQRPRMQSRVEVLTLNQGDGAIFAVNRRPKQGARAYSRVTMRHGVSRIRSGERMTAGIIYHDAK